MNWEVISQYLPLYQKAMWLTLRIGWMGIAFSIIIGLICALIVHYKIPVARQIVKIYIELFRNTPLLVQLFFLYFGLPKIGVRLSGEWCAVIGLIFLGASYMAEALRSGLTAVEKIQTESARVLGLSPLQTMRFVVLPQALAVAMPGFVANVIFLIKEISVVSAIALPDLMYVTKDLIGNYYKTDEALLMLVVAYIIILLPVSLFGSWLERRMRHAGFGV